MDNTSSVKLISECFIRPKLIPEESKSPYYLSPWDLAMLSVNYIQKGLLFLKPSEAYDQPDFMKTLQENLKDSLALALVHFYPLSGRLATLKKDNPKCYSVFVDCNNSPGAKFIYAVVNMTVSDVLGPRYVPLVVQSIFDHHKAVGHDGHTQSLLSVKVTELVDGVFIGLSMNHMMGDGSSFWQFFNSWSEIFRAQDSNNSNGTGLCITNPPTLKRWFPDGYGPILNLPFSHPDEFITRHESPVLKERMFHFSPEIVKRLKDKANKECGGTATISSLQSLTALMWRCLTRARRLCHDQQTGCKMAANNRARLDPPLPGNYFGNCIYAIGTSATVGDLLEHDFGWAALKLHQAVINHSDEKIRQWVDNWVKSPFVYQIQQLFERNSVMMGSSPRFNKYGSEFGMGKAVTLRSGYATKFDGKISAYPGREGGGSMDLEVCLIPEVMDALESDEELMSLVSA